VFTQLSEDEADPECMQYEMDELPAQIQRLFAMQAATPNAPECWDKLRSICKSMPYKISDLRAVCLLGNLFNS